MSISDAIKDMEKHMGVDNFEGCMNAPLPHNNQGYVQRDYKTGVLWVHCCHCGKKQFSITDETKIAKLPWKCKASGCRKEFEVNVWIDQKKESFKKNVGN